MCLQAVFSHNSGFGTSVSKPKKTTTTKVLAALVRSEGCFVVVQKMCRNLRSMSTKLIKGNYHFNL